MNRREFVKSLAAASVVPALPMQALSAAPGAAVSKATQFWAIYLSRLHGDVTPKMLSSATGIAPAQAAAARTALIADNVIRPIGFAQRTMAATSSVSSNAKSTAPLREKLKNAFDAVADIGDEAETTDDTQSELLTDGDPIEPDDTQGSDRS